MPGELFKTGFLFDFGQVMSLLQAPKVGVANCFSSLKLGLIKSSFKFVQLSPCTLLSFIPSFNSLNLVIN